MTKQKIRKIELGQLNGDYQEVFINDERYEFNIYWTAATVIDELSQYYEFDHLDQKDLEVLW